MSNMIHPADTALRYAYIWIDTLKQWVQYIAHSRYSLVINVDMCLQRLVTAGLIISISVAEMILR
jgi:hypothetical protein